MAVKAVDVAELPNALRIDPMDNVAIVLRDIAKGESILLDTHALTATEDIPAGHKVALEDLPAKASVRKYGYTIGLTTQPVRRGDWVHVHNLKTALSGKETYEFHPSDDATTAVRLSDDAARTARPQTFLGYVRANGDVGIRNEIWILNTVGCINKTAEQLARMANEDLKGLGLDGVVHFSHPYGCSQLGDDLHYTQKALAGLARHPNAACVLVLGLGCENNRLDVFQPLLDDVQPERIRYMSVQSVDDELEEGLRLIRELAAYAVTFQRQPLPMSKLKVGMKCGGSDGFSGITANPLVGALSDVIVDAGGTALLTEVPEMFGAETILMDRAQDESVFDQIAGLINNFKDYYARYGQVIYENPSPGNKDGGITTLEEKSLGCIQKGGSRRVSGVLQYGEPARDAGLHLIQAPGNDMVSVTALAAAGAQLILFTTGRGTPMGGPVPTLKVSTNSELATRKKNWIDFNAGSLMEGQTLHSLRDELLKTVVEVASGERTVCNERNGFREIAIFKDGVTL